MPKDEARDVALLLKVLNDLEDFLPYLVLVGGWVPFLYVRYLWEEGIPDPLMTMDIDFGLKSRMFKGRETIAERVTTKGYGEHRVELGKDVPFVPVVRLDKKGARADVEFISDLKTPDEIRKKLVGGEILVNKLPFVDVLQEKTIKIDMEGISVDAPEPAHYIFHKLLTFIERSSDEKRGKDLYYAYFVLRFGPPHSTIKQTLLRLILRHARGKKVAENIKKYFKDAFSKGPNMIFEQTEHSSLASLGVDIRRDSFEKFRALLKTAR